MASRNVLIIGANGALGKATAETFARRGWQAMCADLTAAPKEVAPLGSVELRAEMTIAEMQTALLAGARSLGKFDAVVNVAGGWAGGNVADAQAAANAELMLRQSVFSSMAAAHVAATTMGPNGLLILPGAAAALGPTSFMLGYGMAKAAVHHLIRSIAADPSVMPAGSCVLGVLPTTLDTPGNRAGMPDADFSTWTPTAVMADKIAEWAASPEARPSSGTLVSFHTAGGQTTFKNH